MFKVEGTTVILTNYQVIGHIPIKSQWQFKKVCDDYLAIFAESEIPSNCFRSIH